jgi:hypothetical protein
MNLFRSEDDVRSWVEYEAEMEWTLHPVAWWAETFSGDVFRERGRGDYISWISSEDGVAAWAYLRSRLSP